MEPAYDALTTALNVVSAYALRPPVPHAPQRRPLIGPQTSRWRPTPTPLQTPTMLHRSVTTILRSGRYTTRHFGSRPWLGSSTYGLRPRLEQHHRRCDNIMLPATQDWCMGNKNLQHLPERSITVLAYLSTEQSFLHLCLCVRCSTTKSPVFRPLCHKSLPISLHM